MQFYIFVKGCAIRPQKEFGSKWGKIMKSKVLLLFFLITIFISGCSKNDTIIHDYALKGENDHWIAEYIGHSEGEFYKENGKLKYRGNSREKLTLTYKGELSELSTVRKVGYSFSSGGGTTTFGEPPDRKVFIWDSEGSSMITKEDTERVNITIDDKTETIEMKRD